MEQCAPTTARSPIDACASITAYGPIDAVAATVAEASMHALGWIPRAGARAGCRIVATRAYVAYGLSETSFAAAVTLAKSGPTMTAPAPVVASCARYLGFARNAMSRGPACSSVATRSTMTAPSPSIRAPTRRASSSRLIGVPPTLAAVAAALPPEGGRLALGAGPAAPFHRARARALSWRAGHARQVLPLLVRQR